MTSVKNLTYHARLLGIDGSELVSQKGSASAPENRSVKVGRISYTLPAAMAGRSFFLSVELRDPQGALVSSLMYPIGVSKSGDLEAFADLFDDMNAMPAADLKVVGSGRVRTNAGHHYRAEPGNAHRLLCQAATS